MVKKVVNTKAALLSRLAKEGKVTALDTPKDLKRMEEMDERLRKLRREYQIKLRRSQISAASVILTS